MSDNVAHTRVWAGSGEFVGIVDGTPDEVRRAFDASATMTSAATDQEALRAIFGPVITQDRIIVTLLNGMRISGHVVPVGEPGGFRTRAEPLAKVMSAADALGAAPVGGHTRVSWQWGGVQADYCRECSIDGDHVPWPCADTDLADRLGALL